MVTWVRTTDTPHRKRYRTQARVKFALVVFFRQTGFEPESGDGTRKALTTETRRLGI